MSAARIGAVTIGQAPRNDVVPELSSHLGSGVEIVQRGALDDLSLEEVRAHMPVSGATTLVSRMRDGTEVAIEKSYVLPRLQENIRSLETEVELILLLCTAPFDNLQSKVPLLCPGSILEHVVTGMRVRRLGVLTPAFDQIAQQRDRWSEAARDVVVEAASPYAKLQRLERAAVRLADAEVDIVVMDCIGYTSAMKAIVRRALDKPTMTATGVLGRVVAEMLDCENA